MENWDDLRFVLAMIRHGTMSAAARRLDTNVATVSRRLERVSQTLDTPLYEKRGQGFVATAAAERLGRIAEDLDQRLRGTVASLGDGEGDGQPVPIELAAPPAVHAAFLLPHLDALSRELPHVRLTLSDKVFAQGLGEADVQVRIGRPDGGRLKARKFLDFELAVYHRAGRALDGRWVGLSQRYPDANHLRRIYADAAPDPLYRVEEMPMVYEIVRRTGLPGLLPEFMVRDGDGLARAELPDNALPGELWIAYHETRHGDGVLRAVIEWLCRPDA